ncbi:MAG: SRPBCC family protein [Acetobacteraceae bacterium]|nr:SRPBCC family protein [Acetobacteraceae bacterium]
MTKFTLPIAATAALAVSTSSALALDSIVNKQSSMSADAVWKKIGDFCGIQNWIPAVEKCVLSKGGKERTVYVKGDGQVLERLDNWDDAKRTYSYTILSSGLPVDDYHSTISVEPNGNGSVLSWHGTYKAKGTSDAEAKKLIDGIYADASKTLLGE